VADFIKLTIYATSCVIAIFIIIIEIEKNSKRGDEKMTKLERVSREKFGSMRKLAESLGLTPACIHQVSGGYRRAWPKLRQQIAAALEIQESELFDTAGWPREVERGHEHATM